MNRAALALGIVGLILGAAALGYATYLGLSQLPSQLSSVEVNQTPQNITLRIEWTTANTAGQDRFYPSFFTVRQGDTVNIVFETNDTTDAHTFTTSTAFRGITSGVFQLNNSLRYLSSGPFIKPFENFTGGPGQSCSDQNGSPVTCVIYHYGTFTSPSGVYYGPNSGRNITSYAPFTPTVPGIYRFFCFYHQLNGMFGFLTVLPNKGFTG